VRNRHPPSGRWNHSIALPRCSTKRGLIADPARPHEDSVRTLAPGSIRREVEASLRRLGVERIDLYECHWPNRIGTPVEHSWAEMARLVEAGKVRAVGVSNFDVPLPERGRQATPWTPCNRPSR
jgi:aryl-alcohol dehydrogenase-like predicted oxidoreductase